MRITLNFATRPYADLGPAIKRLRIAAAVLAMVAIGLGVILHAVHRKAEAARARAHLVDSEIARIIDERRGYQELLREPANAQVVAEADALNRLFGEKAFSWTLAMEDLETVLPSRVQVSNLEPARAKDGHTTLHMRVIGPRDRGLELVSNLEHSKRFFLPRIVGENTESVGGPNETLEPVSVSNRVNFDLLAEYNPASLDERRATQKPDQHLHHDSPPEGVMHAIHPAGDARHSLAQENPYAVSPMLRAKVGSPTEGSAAGHRRLTGLVGYFALRVYLISAPFHSGTVPKLR